MRNLDIRITLVCDTHPIHVRKVLKVKYILLLNDVWKDWRPLRWWWQRQWLNLLLPSKISPWWKDFHPELASWTSRHNVRRNNSYRNLYLSNMIIWKPCTSVYYISLVIWTHINPNVNLNRDHLVGQILVEPGSESEAWHSLLVPHDDLQRWIMMIYNGG